MNREALVEAITREVLSALSTRFDMAETGEKVREVVANGADRVAFHGEAADVPLDVAQYIDHTLLVADATADDIDMLCSEAEQYGFASVCINPTWVKRAANNLRGTKVPVCTVIGFPLGATTTDIKATETRKALRDGAREIDMVINVGALKSGDHEMVYNDIVKVVDAAHETGAICKVILETALLTDEEKVIASALAKRAKADFVKTSTGFGPGGATVYDVALMRETVGPDMGVKASGGVRTANDLEDMIAAGATRIGASAGVQIVGGSDGGDSDERY
ncbi:MAG: deoxyribose-phosphate aldolase [Actinobacteria bacterium]|nr:deoxyribose-phosphate aldolase [Actinomycetota bacterium]MCZ6567391.1 deoxyribose-phosphate aldolase [Actinomycetota bacterium]MCZ6736816.1 deoxyribose-phosphate aldolase [Actinomycetota bacterium]